MRHAMNGLSTLAIALVATALTACTGQVAQSSSTQGAGGSGGSSGSGGQPGTGDVGGGSPSPDCTVFLDQQGTSEVAVHIVNQRPTPVFLRESCTVSFYVIDSAGTKHPLEHDWQETRCGDAQKGNYAFGDCMEYSKATIEPGATWDTWWNGAVYDRKVMPSECKLSPWPGPASPEWACEQAVVAAPGPMTFVVRLDSTADYPEMLFEASAPFVLGTDTSIDIVVN